MHAAAQLLRRKQLAKRKPEWQSLQGGLHICHACCSVLHCWCKPLAKQATAGWYAYAGQSKCSLLFLTSL
jgi:hypothetical protein